MNTDKKDLGTQLAYAALDDVPQAKADAKEIVGLVKSGGRITGYQLSDGSTVRTVLSFLYIFRSFSPFQLVQHIIESILCQNASL